MEPDTSKDDPTIEQLDDPIEVRIRITPEIRTIIGSQGMPRSWLHFVIQSDGEIGPGPFFHWTQRYDYYGKREGQVWEEIKAHWLAQYHYVVANIKFALMRKADTLCGEAAVANWDNVEWESFLDEAIEALHAIGDRYAKEFPPEPRGGSYSDMAWARIEALYLGISDMIDAQCRLLDTPNGDDLARLIMARGDTRAEQIRLLWADRDVLIKFARLVIELKPVWTAIKAQADSCDSKEEQDEWLSAVISDRSVIQDYMARYPKLTADVLRRAVDKRLKPVDREPYTLAFFHAILELEVQIDSDTLSIYDAYMKYEGKPPAPTTLRRYFYLGKTLLQQPKQTKRTLLTKMP